MGDLHPGRALVLCPSGERVCEVLVGYGDDERFLAVYI